MPLSVMDAPLTETEERNREEHMAWGACKFPGCLCPQYMMDMQTDSGVCQRPECGHSELEHSVA